MKKYFVLILILFLSSITFTQARKKRAFEYQTGYLKNGLKFIVVERKYLPLVNFSLMFKRGVYHEKKPGTANLVASTLIYGNEYMSPQRVISKLDLLGASVGVSAGYDSIELSASMRSSTKTRVLKIISRIVRLPVFDNRILRRFKMRTLSALKAQKESIPTAVRMKFYKQIYGNHPYARDTMGDFHSVRQITRNDLINYHKKYFVPNNAVAVFVGDITYNKAKRLLERYFSNWKKKKLPPQKNYNIPPIEQKTVIANYPTSQGYVRMGHISIRRNHPMYYKLLVYNAILGGSGFGSRLTKIIREKYGLTYGIVSYFYVQRKQRGYFHINFSTKLSKIKFAIKKIYAILDEYLKKGPTKQELEDIKKYLTGTLIFSRETPSQLASKILEMELYGLEPYFWEKETMIINNITLDDVKEAAKYLHKNKFAIVIIADLNKVELKKESLRP